MCLKLVNLAYALLQNTMTKFDYTEVCHVTADSKVTSLATAANSI